MDVSCDERKYDQWLKDSSTDENQESKSAVIVCDDKVKDEIDTEMGEDECHHDADISAATVLMKRVQERMKHLQESNRRQAAELQKLTGLKSELASCKEKVAKLEIQLNKCASEDLRVQQDKGCEEMLEGKLKHAEKIIKRLRNYLKDANDENSSLKDDLIKMLDSNTYLKKDLIKANIVKSSLEKKLKYARKKNLKLKADLDSLTKDNSLILWHGIHETGTRELSQYYSMKRDQRKWKNRFLRFCSKSKGLLDAVDLDDDEQKAMDSILKKLFKENIRLNIDLKKARKKKIVQNFRLKRMTKEVLSLRNELQDNKKVLGDELEAMVEDDVSMKDDLHKSNCERDRLAVELSCVSEERDLFRRNWMTCLDRVKSLEAGFHEGQGKPADNSA